MPRVDDVQHVIPIIQLYGNLLPRLPRVGRLEKGSDPHRPPMEGVVEDEIAIARVSRWRREPAPGAPAVKGSQPDGSAGVIGGGGKQARLREQVYAGVREEKASLRGKAPLAGGHRQRVGLPGNPSVDGRIDRRLMPRAPAHPSFARTSKGVVGEPFLARELPRGPFRQACPMVDRV